ncbi:hypothetical protein ASE61_06975 [Bosea sp. Root670]|nr:hypothetical protein ASE61_06975 [Bosea sp. Root670]
MTKSLLVQGLKTGQNVEERLFGRTPECSVRLEIVLQTASRPWHRKPRGTGRQVMRNYTYNIWVVHHLLVSDLTLKSPIEERVILLLKCRGVQVFKGILVSVVSNGRVHDAEAASANLHSGCEIHLTVAIARVARSQRL